MILKSYIVEQNINILQNYHATLIYGKNIGIKNDIKSKIKDNNENSELLTFFESDLLKGNVLFESISNQSLFSEKRIIIIQEATEKVFDKIQECLEKEINNVQIYIFAENLEKKTKLRNLFEKETNLAIFPCYEDNARTLISYINKELSEFKGLTGEILNLIIDNSSMDRRIIKNEIEKIKSFFVEKKINKEQTLEILNIRNDVEFNEIRDKALVGDKSKINMLLSGMEILNDEAFYCLNSLNIRIMRLSEISRLATNNNFEHVMDNLKPPVFWKDKPIILQQLRKWNLKNLKELLLKIGETEILMKKNSYLKSDVIIKNLIVKLAGQASTSC